MSQTKIGWFVLICVDPPLFPKVFVGQESFMIQRLNKTLVKANMYSKAFN
tara:strand:+ start:831 stop:980 length:150 start_codon:yes stop_codon:yes gene_type:complete